MSSQQLIEVSTTVAMGIMTLSFLLAAFRALIGPTDADRILALDVVSFVAVGVVALLALGSGSYALLDAAAVPALIGLVATAALARHIAASDGGSS